MIIAVTAFGAEKLNKKTETFAINVGRARAREIRDNKTNTKTSTTKKSAALWSLYNQFRICKL